MGNPTALRGLVTTVVVAAAVVALAPLVASGEGDAGTGSKPVLRQGSFTQGAGLAASSSYNAGVSVGEPVIDDDGDGQRSFGAASSYAVGLADDACPTLAGLDDYDGCPAGVDVAASLKTIDHRPGATCKPCVIVPDDLRMKVFDRNRLDGLRLGSGRSALALTKNPDPSTYDDIFESSDAADAALAGDFGCVGGAAGRCTTGVDQPGDLLAIARFTDDDASKAIYAGRSLAAATFVDTDADSVGDLVVEALQVQKTIDKRGKVTYQGAKNLGLVIGS